MSLFDRQDNWEAWNCDCGNIMCCGIEDKEVTCHDCGRRYYKVGTADEVELRQFKEAREVRDGPA